MKHRKSQTLRGHKEIAALIMIVLGAGVMMFRFFLSRILPPDNLSVEVFQSESGKTDVDKKSDAQTATIHLSGAVNVPGVYRVRSGSRLVDVIKEAGGIGPDADMSGINLASEISDGQKISIPSRTTDSESSAGSRVNINTASASQLEELPGIGQRYAANIVSYRKKNGVFRSIDQLADVPGIGQKRIDQLRDLITY